MVHRVASNGIQQPSSLRAWGRDAWSGLGIFGAVIAAAWLLPRVVLLVVPLTAAALLTALLLPALRWLRGRGMPLLGATWLVMGTGIAVIAGGLLLLIPVLTTEFGALRSSVDGGVLNIEDWLVTGPFHLSQDTVTVWSSDLQAQAKTAGSTLSRGAIAQTPVALHILAGSILTFVLTFFFLKDGESIAARVTGRHSSAATRLESSWSALTGYSRGLVINGLVNAVVLGLALAILGVPLALPLAVITFAASFVPVAGAIIAGVLAALVALVAAGPLTALIVIAVTIVIHHLEGYIVGPLVIGRRTGLHPVTLILALVVGTIVAGIPGAFLAGPVAALLAGWMSQDSGDSLVHL